MHSSRDTANDSIMNTTTKESVTTVLSDMHKDAIYMTRLFMI